MGVVPSLFDADVVADNWRYGRGSIPSAGSCSSGDIGQAGKGIRRITVITGGNVGQAIGPFCIMLLLNRYGLEKLVWCMIPGLLVALLVAKTNYSRPATEGIAATNHVSHSTPKKETLWIALRPELRPLIVLYLITTLRTVTTVGV